MYSENWDKTAKRIKEAAGGKCEKCGHPSDYKSGHVLTVHHINALKWDDRSENLVALCQRCHLAVQPRAVAFGNGQISLF